MAEADGVTRGSAQLATAHRRVPEPRGSTGRGGSAASSGEPAAARRSDWGVPLAVVVVGMFMVVLDTSIVNVAIPTMQGQFGASPDDIEWIATAYTLCLGVVVPTSAWLGERLGLRRTYLISLVLFALFSAMCGTAADLDTMIAYRILQAIPGGIIPVTCLTILYRLVPPAKLGTAMGLYGLGVVFAPGVGPTLGGYLVDYVDWRLIFYINVPIGIVGAIAAMIVLPKFRPAPARPFDVPGFVCIAAACFALLLAVSEGQTWGWGGYRVLILLAGGINLLALFVVIARQVQQPLLNLRAFTFWPYVNSLLLMGIVYTSLFASIYITPLFLQSVQGVTPWNTGLTVMPMALVMAALNPVSGRLFDLFGARWTVMSGMVINGLANLWMSQLDVTTSRTEIIVRTMVSGIGLSMSLMPIMAGGMSVLPPEIVSGGSAIITLVQQAQLFSTRSALTQPDGADVDPRVTAMHGSGPDGLIPLFTEVKHQVVTQSESNAFFLIGLCVLAAIPLACLLPTRRAGGAAAPVDAGH